MTTRSGLAGRAALLLFGTLTSTSAIAADACLPGVYGTDADAFVVIGPTLPAQAHGQRYLFLDGRRGSTDDDEATVTCSGNLATVAQSNDQKRWERQATEETDVVFESAH